MKKFNTALVCIAKNEDNYIQEWVEYYVKLGFDRIFIYQNDWRCSFEHPNVIKCELDGYGKQFEAYNTFIQEHHEEFKWAAFFDVDEFLVLKRHSDINEFLEEYKQYPAIGISWYFFGANGHEIIDNNNYSVIDRFTKRNESLDLYFKSIVKLNQEVVMTAHNRVGTTYFTNGKELIDRGCSEGGTVEVAQLNHYFVKTMGEFEKKVARGMPNLTPDHPEYIRPMSYFNHHNNNDTEDLLAYNFKHDIKI